MEKMVNFKDKDGKILKTVEDPGFLIDIGAGKYIDFGDSDALIYTKIDMKKKFPKREFYIIEVEKDEDFITKLLYDNSLIMKEYNKSILRK